MTEQFSTGPGARAAAENAVSFYQHGWHSWCYTAWLNPDDVRRPIANERDRLGHDDPLHAFDPVPGGSGCGAVAHADGHITLLGALAGGAWVTFDGSELVGTYEAGTGPWVTLTGGEQAVFDEYARLLSEHRGRRGGSRMRLWASWYSFYEEVTEAAMRDVLAGLDGFDFDVVQVDDGWERTIGDWRPNAKFPSGMADMAERIRSTGRRAGLWLAPFIALPGSAIAAGHPQFLLRDGSGEPVVAGVNWGSPYWALDVTRTDTLEYLGEVFAGLTRDGYDFFKLDFIYAAAFPGEYANPLSRHEAYRRVCQHLRDVVGDDTYLLACGAPIVDSIGVFDGIRIGPDVGPVWDDGTYAAAHPAVTTAMHRLWLRPAIDPDPDVVYFRKTELGDETSRHLQAMAQVTGFLGTSDPPASLTGEERSRLEVFLTHAPEVEQVARYAWRVDGTEFDFSPVLDAGIDEPDWERTRP